MPGSFLFYINVLLYVGFKKHFGSQYLRGKTNQGEILDRLKDLRNILMASVLGIMGAVAFGCESQQTGPLGMDTKDKFIPAAELGVSPFKEESSMLSREVSPSAVPSIGACDIFYDGVTSWILQADCETPVSVVVPDGYTLDLNTHSITGTGSFAGGVVTNAGASMHVLNGTVAATATGGCLSGDARLRGILFAAAGGSVTNMTVNNIHRGPNGCQEGNGIEVRNEPFDDTGTNPFYVVITGTTVTNYQKTGIVANGTVNVLIEHNTIGASAAQEVLAANSIQLGFGAMGTVAHNNVSGNQWKGASDFAASAILVFDAQDVLVSANQLDGNSDIGLFIFSDGGLYEYNDVRDFGADNVDSFPYDIGVGDYGAGNQYNHNRVCGFSTPFDPSTVLGKNVTLPDKACS